MIPRRPVPRPVAPGEGRPAAVDGGLAEPGTATGATDDRAQRGSALLLVPAGVLVVMVLASLALDAAIVFAAQRQLSDAASAAANDAVTAALDETAFYDCGALRLDVERAATVAHASVAARTADIIDAGVEVTAGRLADGRPTVTVRLAGEVETVFRPAVGAPAPEPVAASATAVAERAGPPPAGGCGG